MTRQRDTDQLILPHISRASEHSLPFSDLRADADTRLLRLWLDSELEGDETSWRSIDIARGGLSIIRKFKTAEYANTQRNENLLKQMSRSAFTLYQPGKLADADGNLVAISLSRNSSLMLGRALQSPFDALHGSALSPNHVGLYVDDDDILGIEAYDLDNMPQMEVIAADSNTAVHTGLAVRDYLHPRQVASEGITIIGAKPVHPPLNGAVRSHPPQFLPNESVPIGDLTEQFAQSR